MTVINTSNSNTWIKFYSLLAHLSVLSYIYNTPKYVLYVFCLVCCLFNVVLHLMF
jgi:hypothetical protein